MYFTHVHHTCTSPVYFTLVHHPCTSPLYFTRVLHPCTSPLYITLDKYNISPLPLIPLVPPPTLLPTLLPQSASSAGTVPYSSPQSSTPGRSGTHQTNPRGGHASLHQWSPADSQVGHVRGRYITWDKVSRTKSDKVQHEVQHEV